MPTYQYECSACGHQMEALQSMTDKRLNKCPACGKKTLDRLIGGGTGFIFKGTGFYETDYKKKPSSSSGESKPAPAVAPCSGSCACHPPSPKKS